MQIDILDSGAARGVPPQEKKAKREKKKTKVEKKKKIICMQQMQNEYNAPNRMHISHNFSGGENSGPLLILTQNRVSFPPKILAARLILDKSRISSIELGEKIS